MRRRRLYGLAALGAAAALTLAACSSSGSSSSGGSGGNTSGAGSAPAFNSGVTSVVNPSTHKGGTLTFDWRGPPGPLHPRETHHTPRGGVPPVSPAPLTTYQKSP